MSMTVEFLNLNSELSRAKGLETDVTRNKIQKFIMDEAGVSENVAKRVFNFAYYHEKSRGILAVIQLVDDLVDLIIDCKRSG